jgi:hypothetical protein
MRTTIARTLLPLTAVALAGCATAFPTAAMPVTLGPVPGADARTWAASTLPPGHLILRFHWHLIADGSSGGRGAVLVAPPDSLRLDFRGPVGFGSGAAGVIGDSAIWAEPQDQVQKFVPSYPLLWAMVGIARPPRGGWAVEGSPGASTAARRYTHGADRVDYLLRRTGVTILEAYVRQDGKPLGHVVTVFDVDGHLARSRLDVLTTRARLEITFDKTSKQTPFGRDSWLAPHDQ